MKKLLSCAAAAVALSGLAAAPAHAARDYVWAAGSSTVFPFATRTAENLPRRPARRPRRSKASAPAAASSCSARARAKASRTSPTPRVR